MRCPGAAKAPLVPKPPQRASVVKRQMDEANAILLGALNGAAYDAFEKDPSAAELVTSTTKAVDGAAWEQRTAHDGSVTYVNAGTGETTDVKPTETIVSKDVTVHAEIDMSIGRGMDEAKAHAAEDAKAKHDAEAQVEREQKALRLAQAKVLARVGKG